MNGFEYIRNHYHVPARRLCRVRLTCFGRWNGALGTVTGTYMGGLLVKPDVRPYKSTRFVVNPREVEYLTGGDVA